MKLSDLIKQFRNDNGISQRKFAIMTGLSNSTISLIENDSVNPYTGNKMVFRLDTYAAIANAMNITLDTLLRTIDDTPIDISNITPMSNSLSADDREVLDLFHTIPADLRPVALQQLRALASVNDAANKKDAR